MEETSNPPNDVPETVVAELSLQELFPLSWHAQAGYPAPSGHSGQLRPAQTSNDVPVTLQRTSQHAIRVQPLYEDHMDAALFAAYCCFYPTGKRAVRRVRDARNAMARGDVSTAIAYAEEAKSLIHTSKVLGVITLVLVIIALAITLPLVYA